jgi:predicted RNase H-like HicB family nuclease
MATVFFPAIIERAKRRGYGVFFPDLPGLAAAGDTLQHAADQAREALEFHIAGMVDDGEQIPTPTSLEDIPADPEVKEAARVLVPVSIASHRTVRVNITLPEDLIERIDRVAPNRSRFLAEAAEKALAAAE